MVSGKSANRSPLGPIGHSFLNEFSQHANKARMGARGISPDHLEAEFLANLPGFFIQVEENLHMVRQKADRHDQDHGLSLGF